MAVSGLYGLLCFPFGLILKICNSLPKKPCKHLHAFSLDEQISSLLGVCHHYSQKLARFSEIIQILIYKEHARSGRNVTLTCGTLDLAEKQLHLIYNALKDSEHFRDLAQHNFVSFFTQVYWSGITYMFPEAKKGADINVSPSVSPWRERGEMRSQRHFWLVCIPLQRIFGEFGSLVIPGWKHLFDPTEMLSMELANWARILQLEPSLTSQLGIIKGRGEQRRVTCSPGSFLGLQTRQLSRKHGNEAVEFIFSQAETLRYWN